MKSIAILILLATMILAPAEGGIIMIQESSGTVFWVYDIIVDNGTTSIWVSENDLKLWLDPPPNGTIYLAWPGS